MNRVVALLDPRNSLASAFGWLAALLSLTIAIAMVWVSNVARDHILAARDNELVSDAEALAAELDGTLAPRLAVAPDPSTTALAALTSELPGIVAAAREHVHLHPMARAVVMDDDQRVLVDSFARGASGAAHADGPAISVWTEGRALLRIRRDGRRDVAAQARTEDRPALRRLGLQVLVIRPSEGTLWQGSEMQRRIAWLCLAVSVVAAAAGVAFAHGLTRRLKRLTIATQRIATNPDEPLAAPAGHDEVSALGKAFSSLLESLRRERDALNTLTMELERRVQARTREVERLAADSRYAAVVRERLRLARDLHDTLAHSMMAMLAEIRTLRKLHVHDAAALGPELERAERLAHDGLKAAREAIGQMRLNAVRDLGLGPALHQAVDRLADRTGLKACYTSDPRAASFADSRAEVLFRIATEALRNVERHAGAARIDVSLRDGDDGSIELAIEDDGVGFDPDARHPGHYGLVGMREQAQLIGAEFTLTSAAQRGTRLQLWLQVGPEHQAPDAPSAAATDVVA